MRITVVFILFLLSLTACGSDPTVHAVKPAQRTIEATVSGVTSGTVRAEKVAELAFGAVGRVKTLNVKVGDIVKSGAVLAEIENQDLVSILETTRRENVRRQQLRASNALAQTDLDQILRDVQMAQVAFDKSKIIAPYDGLIVEQNLEVGQLSQITAVEPVPLIKIVDLGPRYVRAEIDEVDLSRVAVGQKARIKILAIRREPFAATVRKVVRYISSVREQDRTAEIELSVDNEDGSLPAGASADIEVIVDTHDNVLSLPTRAVLGRGANRHIFVVENGRIKKRPVQVGIFNYDFTEITSGLNAEELVVIPSEGVDLADGLRVKVATDT